MNIHSVQKRTSPWLIVAMLPLAFMGCAGNYIPTDAETKKLFEDHRAEFKDVKDRLLAEKDRAITIESSYQPAPGDTVSAETLVACKTLMQKINSLEIRRVGNTARFAIGEVNNEKKRDAKEIIFDEYDIGSKALAPIKLRGYRVDFLVLEPGWKVEHTVEDKKAK
jgi:hypothetical protein